MVQARALEACHRAGVEVVIMSGRREPQVHEDARLMGQDSYIYEAGCAFAIDGETTLLTGEMAPSEDRHDLRADGGSRASRRCSSSTSTAGSSTTRPGTPAASTPTSSAARSTSTEANRAARRARRTTTCGCSTTARSAARWRRIEGRPTPTTWSRAWSARRRRSPPTPGPAATTRPSASRSATRSRTSRSPPRSAASSSSPTGPSATPALRAALAAWDNATVTEGRMGDGFYEAVVSTLVERR